MNTYKMNLHANNTVDGAKLTLSFRPLTEQQCRQALSDDEFAQLQKDGRLTLKVREGKLFVRRG